MSEASARAKVLALEKMIASLPISCSGGSLSIGASAGVTMLRHTDRLANVMARADANMYSRKQNAARGVA